MAILEIRTLGDPILKSRAAEVTTFDGDLARLADDMLETMRAAPGVGLAAPQVGRLIRLFVWDDGEDQGAMVNPTITWFSEDTEEAEEGCLSVPGFYFPVTRSVSVKVSAKRVDGTVIDVTAEGFRARVFQHEIDHLDGILFIDRLSPEARKEAMRHLREQDFGMSPPPGEPTKTL